MAGKTTVPPQAGGRPRARHDVGVEPLDWMRIVVVLTFVLIASGGGLGTAGLLRQGPLRDIGWTDRRLERFAVESPRGEVSSLGVGVQVPADTCALEVTVEVVETDTEVLLGPVSVREPRVPLTAPGCRGGLTPVRGRVFGAADLAEPLGSRRVLQAGNRSRVDYIEPRPAPSPSAGIPSQRSGSPAASPSATG